MHITIAKDNNVTCGPYIILLSNVKGPIIFIITFSIAVRSYSVKEITFTGFAVNIRVRIWCASFIVSSSRIFTNWRAITSSSVHFSFMILASIVYPCLSSGLGTEGLAMFTSFLILVWKLLSQTCCSRTFLYRGSEARSDCLDFVKSSFPLHFARKVVNRNVFTFFVLLLTYISYVNLSTSLITSASKTQDYPNLENAFWNDSSISTILSSFTFPFLLKALVISHPAKTW